MSISVTNYVLFLLCCIKLCIVPMKDFIKKFNGCVQETVIGMLHKKCMYMYMSLHGHACFNGCSVTNLG